MLLYGRTWTRQRGWSFNLVVNFIELDTEWKSSMWITIYLTLLLCTKIQLCLSAPGLKNICCSKSTQFSLLQTQLHKKSLAVDAQWIRAEHRSLTGGTAAGRGFVRERSFHLREFQGNSLLGLWCKKWTRLKAIARIYTLPPPLCSLVPGLPHDPHRMPTTHRLVGWPFCCPERAQEHTLQN